MSEKPTCRVCFARDIHREAEDCVRFLSNGFATVLARLSAVEAHPALSVPPIEPAADARPESNCCMTCRLPVWRCACVVKTSTNEMPLPTAPPVEPAPEKWCGTGGLGRPSTERSDYCSQPCANAQRHLTAAPEKPGRVCRPGWRRHDNPNPAQCDFCVKPNVYCSSPEGFGVCEEHAVECKIFADQVPSPTPPEPAGEEPERCGPGCGGPGKCVEGGTCLPPAAPQGAGEGEPVRKLRGELAFAEDAIKAHLETRDDLLATVSRLRAELAALRAAAGPSEAVQRWRGLHSEERLSVVDDLAGADAENFAVAVAVLSEAGKT